MKNLSETTLAYVAGLFDGEGSIVIGVSKPNAKRGNKSPSHWLQVGITNTHQPLMVWLTDLFDGHISSHCTNTSAKGKKDCWCWRVMSNEAAKFLERLLPYLIIKREQAELAIQFQHERSGLSSKLLTPEVIERRDWFKSQISSRAIQSRSKVAA